MWGRMDNFAEKPSTTSAAETILPSIRDPFQRLFPVLSDEHVRVLSLKGSTRETQPDEILVNAGDRSTPFFVLTSGQIEIVRPSFTSTAVVAVLNPGQFTGEMTLLSGRRALVTIRVRKPGAVIELSREDLVSLVQDESEVGEIIMRSFLLRRVELISHGLGDATLIGSRHSADTLRVQEFLTRNGHPYSYLDLDRDPEVQQLLDRFQVSVDDVPVLICGCGKDAVLRNPTDEEIAACLEFNDEIDPTPVRDVVVVGAGPSGLAAAVYGASEGLDVLVLESGAPGGQAGSSSKIENYLGFPTGISGQDLTGRAYTQAQKFGAQIAVAKGAARLSCDQRPYSVILNGNERILTRAVVIASGAEYRRPSQENASQFEGSGLYYEATQIEAQRCTEEEVIVVGGGNSAGQAAVFLARTASKVHVFVRSHGLAESMSRYLIRRIEDNPKIELRTQTEIVKFEGNGHLEQVSWRDKSSGAITTANIRHVFFMAGALPCTGWLGNCVALDDKGFVKTGMDLTPETLTTAHWPLKRPPHLLESSIPGIFAVGDVRSGSIKRVASAVGEGSISIAFVHQSIRE